ncbi:MAG: hypothetical protein QXX51_09050 [Candidatus Bathyarchaeia archaeon]
MEKDIDTVLPFFPCGNLKDKREVFDIWECSFKRSEFEGMCKHKVKVLVIGAVYDCVETISKDLMNNFGAKFIRYID